MNILRYADVARKCRVSEMTIRRWATDPDNEHLNFEKPIPLGDNSVGFDEAGVDSWLAERAAKRDDADVRVAAKAAERDDVDADGNDAEDDDDDDDEEAAA